MENRVKDELKAKFKEHLDKLTVSKYRRSTPLMVDDVMTFTVTDKTNLEDWCENNAKNGEIGAYRMIISDEGHRVSEAQLTRHNNGLNIQGATPDEALLNFFLMCLEKPVQVKVISCKIMESTRRTRDGERVYRFEVLSA